MMGLNKVGTGITVIVALTLTALSLEIMYLLWRRRRRFMCCKGKSSVGVEPQEASVAVSTSTTSEVTDEDVLKWHYLYGVSRVLFTIKEEEREGLESLELEEIAVAVELKDNTTPFSTPCASPPYFTPSASPTRDSGNGNASGWLVVQQDNITPFSDTNQQKDIQVYAVRS